VKKVSEPSMVEREASEQEGAVQALTIWLRDAEQETTQRVSGRWLRI
jgi:hypothetical protein